MPLRLDVLIEILGTDFYRIGFDPEAVTAGEGRVTEVVLSINPLPIFGSVTVNLRADETFTALNLLDEQAVFSIGSPTAVARISIDDDDEDQIEDRVFTDAVEIEPYNVIGIAYNELDVTVPRDENDIDRVVLPSTEPLVIGEGATCLLYTSPSPRDRQKSRMPSSA